METRCGAQALGLVFSCVRSAVATLTVTVRGPTWPIPRYTQQEAAFPVDFVGRSKFWPTVSRANDIHGDKNVIATLAK